MVATPIRDERFTLLLTLEEREMLDEMAAEAGVDRSTLIRLRVFANASQVFAAPSTAQPAGGPAM